METNILPMNKIIAYVKLGKFENYERLA